MTPALAVVILLGACSAKVLTVPDASDPVTPDASADAPASTPGRKLVVIFGQSNAGSEGLVSQLTDPSIADPYPAVWYVAETGTDNNPPIVTNDPLDALGPRTNTAGQQTFGIELTLGHTLDAARPGQWVIAKFAFGSTALAGEWWPQGVWPPGEPNLFTQEITFVQGVLTATGADLAALIWIQGESDAPTEALGQRYELELAEFFGAERLRLQNYTSPFIYGRLNALNPQPGTAAVRAGQEANQAPLQIMVDQDPFPLRSDLTHYTTEGILELGAAYGQVVLASTPTR